MGVEMKTVQNEKSAVITAATVLSPYFDNFKRDLYELEENHKIFGDSLLYCLNKDLFTQLAMFCYVDLDKDGFVYIEESFESFSTQATKLFPFREQLSLYPGSFNPITNFHRLVISETDGRMIVEISKKRLSKAEYTFVELIKIIDQFFALGVSILITKRPLLVDKISIIEEKIGRVTEIICGSDTMKRIISDYTDVRCWNQEFKVYNRFGCELTPDDMDHINRRKLEVINSPFKYIDVSSTRIRTDG